MDVSTDPAKDVKMKKIGVECKWIKRGSDRYDLCAWGGSAKKSKPLDYVVKTGDWWFVSILNDNKPYDCLADAMDVVETK